MRKADKSDRRRVTDILARAFDGNKSVNYIVPQDRHRRRRILALMEYSFDLCLLKGDVWLSDEGKACALLLYPDRKVSPLHSALLNVRLILRCTGLARLRKTMARETIIRGIRPGGRICYLWFIGVDPLQQGNGTGSLLLEEVLSKCEQAQRPVYLETSMPQNIPWYERYGFTVYHVQEDMGYTLSFLKRTSGK